MSMPHQPPWTLDHKVRYLKPSATLAINEQVTAMRASGRDIYHLGFGESRFPVFPRVIEALRENAHRHAYLPGQGLLELREAVAHYYQRQLHIAIDPSRVIIAPGSKILLYALLLCLEGDLLLPCPSWVSYKPQAVLLNKRIVWVTTRVRDGSRVRVPRLRDAMERARREGVDPRILLLNSPHNPTGVIFEREQLQKIVDFARSEGITIISDEIYALIPHVDDAHLSVSRFYPEGSILTGGLSKHLSLGGWRLGVGIVPEGAAGAKLMNALISVASETWSAVSGPIQYAAVVAYGDDPDIEAYRKACTHLHALRTQYLHRTLAQAGVVCPLPGGAFYLYPCFGPWRSLLRQLGVYTSEQLASFLLTTQEVATLPGSEFGAPPSDLCLRLATSYLDFEEGDEAGWRLLRAYGEDGGKSAQDFVQAHCPRLMEAGRRLVDAIHSWEGA